MGEAGEIKHHVVFLDQRVCLDDFGRDDVLHPGTQQIVSGCAHVACLVAGADEIGGARRVATIGGHAAVDELSGFVHAGCSQTHGRADFVSGVGLGHIAVEVGTGPGRLAVAGAISGIKAECESRRDRHAVHAVGLGPGQRIGLDFARGGAIDPAFEMGELFACERAASGLEAHADHVGGGNAAFFLVVGGNGDAVGVVVVDDDAQLVGGETRLGKVGDHGAFRWDSVRRSPGQHGQHGQDEAESEPASHQASRSTHSRTSSGPR